MYIQAGKPFELPSSHNFCRRIVQSVELLIFITSKKCMIPSTGAQSVLTLIEMFTRSTGAVISLILNICFFEYGTWDISIQIHYAGVQLHSFSSTHLYKSLLLHISVLWRLRIGTLGHSLRKGKTSQSTFLPRLHQLIIDVFTHSSSTFLLHQFPFLLCFFFIFFWDEELLVHPFLVRRKHSFIHFFFLSIPSCG